MRSSRITEALFGFSEDDAMPRQEKIRRIREAIQDERYVDDEKLKAAFEMMLEEIRAG